MAIVGGFDVHRQQITFNHVETETGEVRRGKISPATRAELRKWLEQFDGQPATFAVEGCTGWRFVVEELQAAGIEAHVAEPADTAALRGPKKRAKTDQLDSRHLRELLCAGNIPESWIPPAHVLEARIKVRLYKSLVDERTGWIQRIHAQLFHQGAAPQPGLLTSDGRLRLKAAPLSPAGAEAVNVALHMIDAIAAARRPAARPDRRARAPPARMLRPTQLLRHRRRHIRGDLGRARRLPPVLVLRRRGPPYRSRRHRPLLRQQTRSRASRPPRATHAPLGAVRGRQMRGPAQLTRPRLLPRGPRPSRREPRHPLRRPQTCPTLPPHPARPGRQRVRQGQLRRTARAPGARLDDLRPAPAKLLPSEQRSGRPP